MGLRNKVKSAKIREEDNPYLVNPEKGLELCSNIIANKGDSSFDSGLHIINGILDDFMEIAQKDGNPNSIEAYTKLMKLKEDVINILNFPKLENHYTVAVGGGFSSGKSTFFNKILGLNGVLPTDTNPTTSIPSYITKGDKDRFEALNNFNNRISLNKDAIQALSHAFKKQYNVSFSHIIKLISIEQKDLKYNELVFLDTPGYSKSDSINSINSINRIDNIDENIAREHLRTTDFLIWLVDCQTPISDTDMKFIKTLDLEHPILVVLNKADKKISSDIELLVEKTRENLQLNDISTFDVIGYSSSKDIEYSPSKDVIGSYLNTISSVDVGTKILKRIDKIFNTYIDYYDSKRIENRSVRGVLNKIISVESISEKLEDGIQDLARTRLNHIKDIEKFKKDIEKLSIKLHETITHLFKESGIEIVEKKKDFVFDPKIYENRQKKDSFETIRFPASLQIKNQNDLLKYKNLHTIDASIYRISSIGVFIKIADIDGDILLAKSKILKESGASNIDDVFNIEDKVLVQIIDIKKCIITKKEKVDA